MKCGSSLLFLLYCYLLGRTHISESLSTNLDLQNLYHNNSLSPSSERTPPTDLNFAEGGAYNSNKLSDNVASAVELHGHHNLTGGNNVFDLLADGAPSTGTSGIKPRKGVDTKSIVPRKGAPPCVERPLSNTTQGLPCPPLIAPGPSKEVSLPPPPVYEPSPDSRASTPTPPKKPIIFTSGKVAPSNPPVKNETSAKTASLLGSAKKPTITVVPSDSDELLKALKNDKNVVIPVAALICAPLLVLLMLFIYKRIQDSRGNSQYTRMGFLIEDIYND